MNDSRIVKRACVWTSARESFWLFEKTKKKKKKKRNGRTIVVVLFSSSLLFFYYLFNNEKSANDIGNDTEYCLKISFDFCFSFSFLLCLRLSRSFFYIINTLTIRRISTCFAICTSAWLNLLLLIQKKISRIKSCCKYRLLLNQRV